MTSVTDAPENPLPFGRSRHRGTTGNRVIRWLRANLFSSIPSTIISLLLILVLAKACVSLVQWGFWNAIWSVPGNDTNACRAIRGLGACWAVIPEKVRFILFGTYPFNQQWRPALQAPRHPLVMRALCRAYPRRSLDQPAIHGERHVSAVLAGWCQHRQAASSPDRVRALRRRLSCRSHSRRPAGCSQRAARGRRCARPVVLAEKRLDHSAAGNPSCDPATGEYVHRVLQGYQSGSDHRHLRPADDGQDRHHRSRLAVVQCRGLRVRGADLLRLLLCHVTLQPRS